VSEIIVFAIFIFAQGKKVSGCKNQESSLNVTCKEKDSST